MAENPLRNERDRFSLYRLCDCPTCRGRGQVNERDAEGEMIERRRCPDCRGEGKQRDEVCSTDTEEGVGVALVACAREGEWLDENGNPCAFGLLDRRPECPTCEGRGFPLYVEKRPVNACRDCKGTGIKPTGTWLILPWQPSARNVHDAAVTLAKSKKKVTPS